MIDGRLGLANRWVWCALAFVCGLIFTQCAHATVHQTEAEAWASCQSYAAQRQATTTEQRVVEAECVSDPVPPYTQYSNTRYGAIVCLQYGYPIGPDGLGIKAYDYCGGQGGLGIGDNAESRWAAKEFPSQPYLFSADYNTRRRYAWTEETEPDQCADLQAFDTAAMGPAGGANGIRQVCYQGCVWDVFGGFYAGTYPAGYVYFTFEPLGYECSGEPDPGDPTEGNDDPLDLDPEDGGVDPGPDPGDGNPASSGGATCDSPPQCTGDSLQCNILFQTWATRCAAEAQNDGLNESLDGIAEGLDGIAGGLDGIADGLSDLSDGISNVDQKLGGIRGFLDDVFGSGEDVSGPIPGLSALNTGDKVFDSDSLDQSGFGMPRSCPAILTDSVSFSFFGNQYNINFDMMCNLLELVGQILVVLSAFVGVRILLRSVS